MGLDISESVSDHSTFWRFRQKLEKLSLMDGLFKEINCQLTRQGLIIQSGAVSIVPKALALLAGQALDASVIEANQSRPNKRKDGSSTQDPEAAWNVKAGSDGKRKSTYGYKAHLNVDADGFIKATDYSPSNEHDSNYFTVLLTGDESSVYADSAYKSESHDQWLSQRKIDNRVIKRAYRNRPLSDEGKHFNRLHAGVRCTVERVFGVLKQHYGMRKARYLGLARNRTRFELMCVAHNMKRGLSIQ